jgi:APA family basic amino acid/polyamine antiporter
MKHNKQLSLFDLTIITLSFVIGMGIFRTPEVVAKAAVSEPLFFVAWIIGGAIAICGALTYAEIGSRIPVTGGYYKIFTYAYHPSIAFAVNCIILVSNAASLGAVALVGGEYITGVFIPQSQDIAWLANPLNAHRIQTIQIIIAISAIVILYGVNLLGLKMSSRTQNILTVIKILIVLLLISPLFFAEKPAHIIIQNSTEGSMGLLEYMKAFGVTLVAVCFTYGGYQQTINFGEEVHDSKKTIPRAIFSGIIIILILYLLINFAYVKVIGFNHLKSSKNIAAIMASRVLGINAERVLSILFFLSVLAYVNVLLMSNPRVMAAMSEDHVLPGIFGKRNVKTQVLTASLSVFSAICILIIFWAKKFDNILDFTIFLDSFGMALSAGSIFIIRKKTSYLDNTGIYKMKYYPAIPLIFISAYTFVALIIFITQTKISLIGLSILAEFIGLYFFITIYNKTKKHFS